MSFIRVNFWIFLAVLCLGCATAINPAMRDVASFANLEPSLMAGDVVKVTVFNQPDLSGEFVLDGNGKIWLPLIGGVQAAGLSNVELQQEILSALQPEFLIDPKVVVELVSQRPIYLLGEVNRPGTYPYEQKVTVAKAIALAGGFTHRAKLDKIKIARQARDGELVEMWATLTTIVQGGDLITVSERFF